MNTPAHIGRIARMAAAQRSHTKFYTSRLKTTSLAAKRGVFCGV